MPHPCQFIVDGCELEVNLDSRTRTVLVKRVREGGVDITIFDTLQASAEKQMIGDSLPRCVACCPVFVPQLLCALGPGRAQPSLRMHIRVPCPACLYVGNVIGPGKRQ